MPLPAKPTAPPGRHRGASQPPAAPCGPPRVAPISHIPPPFPAPRRRFAARPRAPRACWQASPPTPLPPLPVPEPHSAPLSPAPLSSPSSPRSPRSPRPHLLLLLPSRPPLTSQTRPSPPRSPRAPPSRFPPTSALSSRSHLPPTSGGVQAPSRPLDESACVVPAPTPTRRLGSSPSGRRRARRRPTEFICALWEPGLGAARRRARRAPCRSRHRDSRSSRRPPVSGPLGAGEATRRDCAPGTESGSSLRQRGTV